MIHKVILQTQQGNIQFTNCLTDIPAIILKYCCSRIHFIVFQLDCILKLYPSQDKYIASHLHTFILLNCVSIEGQDALFQVTESFPFHVSYFVKLLIPHSFDFFLFHPLTFYNWKIIEFAYKLKLQHC